jgi:hypothetical protein
MTGVDQSARIALSKGLSVVVAGCGQVNLGGFHGTGTEKAQRR